MKRVKLLSLFSGIGAFEKALDKIGIGYDIINYCEIDKYASKVYAMIHNCEESKNLEDITKVNTSELPNDIDIVTYGFPCQDISLAGKQKGFEENGERTRSGLFFEALRIIEDKKPKVAICENVKNLTSKKFKKEFEIVLESLERTGYTNYWKVLNAKDYGIPQNRERVFVVSIRKDLDKGSFEFPKSFELKLRLKDLLEDEVDEKYYINTEKAKQLITILAEKNKLKGERVCCDGSINEPKVREVSNCIISRYDKGISNKKQEGLCVVEPVLIGGMQKNQTIKTDGICTTLTSAMGCGGGYIPMIVVKEATKKGYTEAFEGDSINLEQPNSKTRRGRVGRQVAQTLTTQCNQAVVVKNGVTWRIRKLTPKECFRLMGFEDKDFEKIVGISNTQLYKMAGNSIVVDVLECIFKEVFKVVDFENSEKARKVERLIIKIEDGYQLALNL